MDAPVVFSIKPSRTTLWWLLYVCARGDSVDVLAAADTLDLAHAKVVASGLVEWDYEKPVEMQSRITANAYVMTGPAGVRVLSESEARGAHLQPWHPREKARVYKLSKRNAKRKRTKHVTASGALCMRLPIWNW